MYVLMSADGRRDALFGGDFKLASEAFARSLAGKDFPEVWFELPLAGEPWHDFHSLVSYDDVAGRKVSYAGHAGVYDDALAWFAAQTLNESAAHKLALSYDTSRGDVESPAVQLLRNMNDPGLPVDFLNAVGRTDLRDNYLAFAMRMPSDWYDCYVGVFPGREGAECDPWLRVECMQGMSTQRTYANDPDRLRADLESIGMADVSEEAIAGTQLLARSPFSLEMQFNIGADGIARPTLSSCVRFEPRDWADPERRERVYELLGEVQRLGMADNRWKLLLEASFKKRVKKDDETVFLTCYAPGLKLRWRDGQAPDAKVYLIGMAN